MGSRFFLLTIDRTSFILLRMMVWMENVYMVLSAYEKKNLVVIPLMITIILTALFYFSNWDIELERGLYSASEGWFLKDNHPWDWLYDYGTWPGFVLAGTALVVGIGSYRRPAWQKYRKECWVIVLTLAIGSGLIVNAGLKEFWGRPRPRQISEFGGTYSFLPVLVPGIPGQGNSFPSGHASMAFYWMSPFFILRYRWPWIARFFLGLGLGYGILMGTARMVQGGHFASDVLWAWVIMYFTSLCLSLWLKPRNIYDS